MAVGRSNAKGQVAGGAHDELTEKRGYHFAEFDFLAERDPAFEEVRKIVAAATYTPAKSALPVKYREIIAAAVLATKAYPSMDAHLRRALKLGASMQELIEAMEVAAVPGGFPTLHFALGYLVKIDDEMKREAAGKRGASKAGGRKKR